MKWPGSKQSKGKSKISKERFIPKIVRDGVWDRDKGRCVYCRKKAKKIGLFRPARTLQFGHQIAFSRGGDNCMENIQLECRKCNLEKGTSKKSAGIFNSRGVKGCKKRHVRVK